MQFTHVSHIFALHVCTVLCATCMLGAHVHVTTMSHACQVHICLFCYYVTCMSNTHVHVATMPHECQVEC